MQLAGASKNGKSQQVPMVFISYQWDIQDKVLKLKKKLEAKNITCWMDTGEMMGGDDLKKEIDKGIRGCKVRTSGRLLCLFFPCTGIGKDIYSQNAVS